MLSFIIIILCINIDAFSYGVAYGFKKEKFSIFYIFLVTILSTILFAIPLIVSKYVFKLFNPIICHLINGLILISLGIYYFLQKPANYNEKTDKNAQISKNNVNFNNYTNLNITNKNQNKLEINSNKLFAKSHRINIKKYLIETFVISVDAIFTALLSGFDSNFSIFYIFFYAFSNFFAIFLGNLIFYNTNKKIKIKLSYFSGIIFVILGILKFFGI